MSVQSIEDLTLTITLEMRVRASLDVVFAAVLQQAGPGHESPEGKPLPMTLEAWPGGRWFRDLGGQDGHFWGNVQAIKRPTLLELSGPLFASYPLLSNIQYRLSEIPEGTLINFRHTALGFMQDGHRLHVGEGWKRLLERVRLQVEGQGAEGQGQAGQRAAAPAGHGGR
jgi:uncharacterized protein YndB with AHSA1/START domain